MNDDIPIPELKIAPLVQEIRDTHNFYMDPRNHEGTLAERRAKRNAEIKAVFKRFRETRTSGYEKHRQPYRTPVSCKCKDTVSSKSCPGSYDFGPDYEVIDIGASGQVTDFAKSPPSTLSWLIKAGRGKTTSGEVWGTAKLIISAAKRRLDEDVRTLRTALAQAELPDDQQPDP